MSSSLLALIQYIDSPVKNQNNKTHQLPPHNYLKSFKFFQQSHILCQKYINCLHRSSYYNIKNIELKSPFLYLWLWIVQRLTEIQTFLHVRVI